MPERNKMIKSGDITIEVIPHNGHLVLSTIKGTQYIKRVYIGHSKQEAKRLFLSDIN